MVATNTDGWHAVVDAWKSPPAAAVWQHSARVFLQIVVKADHACTVRVSDSYYSPSRNWPLDMGNLWVLTGIDGCLWHPLTAA